MRAGLPLLVLAALAAGCTSTPPTSGDAATPTPALSGTTLSDAWTLTPRGSGELDFQMPMAGRAAFTLNASAEVDWDVHGHAPDGSVETFRRGRGRLVEETFEAPREGTYSLYATATGQTTRVTVRLVGDVAPVAG